MREATTERREERFTARLEAFSDLVFGFSLSLLATRLDVPTRVEDLFEPTRWFAIIGTFGLVCRFWLEHYRVFRHRFVAGTFDAVVNFIFLFAVAILPYAVQAFVRFGSSFAPFALYLCTFSLILGTLSILRLRGLQQRRDDPDLKGRLREWRRSVVQILLALAMVRGRARTLVAWRHPPGGSLRSRSVSARRVLRSHRALPIAGAAPAGGSPLRRRHAACLLCSLGQWRSRFLLDKRRSACQRAA